MRSIVLTGGDHAGKTTLVEALRSEGCVVIPEAALRVIGELNQEHGVDGQRAWRQRNWSEFQARVARTQHGLEDEARQSGARAVVLDRGLPDGIAFCRLEGVTLPDELTRGVRERYDHVLLLETVRPFTPRVETGRLGGLARSVALHDLLLQVYEELGYTPEPLPLQPVAERMRRIRVLLD
ncbi:MAG: ATP-binding protein [Deltaproteobacteria bacterium]|nr:ATP-binding protein [Deltaproteobacteria bacterium]MBW2413666.1 ATP-binding protein [Deltaproteobacteria bacterium]